MDKFFRVVVYCALSILLVLGFLFGGDFGGISNVTAQTASLYVSYVSPGFASTTGGEIYIAGSGFSNASSSFLAIAEHNNYALRSNGEVVQVYYGSLYDTGLILNVNNFQKFAANNDDAWVLNYNGTLNHGNSGRTSKGIISALSQSYITDISDGSDGFCVSTSYNGVRCWGNNTDYLIVAGMPTSTTKVSISQLNRGCAVANGYAYCWNADWVASSTGLYGVSDVAVGSNTIYYIANGQLYAAPVSAPSNYYLSYDFSVASSGFVDNLNLSLSNSVFQGSATPTVYFYDYNNGTTSARVYSFGNSYIYAYTPTVSYSASSTLFIKSGSAVASTSFSFVDNSYYASTSSSTSLYWSYTPYMSEYSNGYFGFYAETNQTAANISLYVGSSTDWYMQQCYYGNLFYCEYYLYPYSQSSYSSYLSNSIYVNDSSYWVAIASSTSGEKIYYNGYLSVVASSSYPEWYTYPQVTDRGNYYDVQVSTYNNSSVALFVGNSWDYYFNECYNGNLYYCSYYYPYSQASQYLYTYFYPNGSDRWVVVASTSAGSIYASGVFSATNSYSEPVAFNYVSVTPNSTSANIQWSNDKDAYAFVYWATTSDVWYCSEWGYCDQGYFYYGWASGTADWNYRTSHSVGLSNLVPNTTYYYLLVASSSNATGTYTGYFSTPSNLSFVGGVSVATTTNRATITFQTNIPAYSTLYLAENNSSVKYCDPSWSCGTYFNKNISSATTSHRFVIEFSPTGNILAELEKMFVPTVYASGSVVYSYLIAINDGRGASSTVSGDFSNSVVPLGFDGLPTVSNLGTSTANIAIRVNSMATVTLEYAICQSGATSTRVLGTNNIATFTLSNLIPNTNYCYRVYAENGWGQINYQPSGSVHFRTMGGLEISNFQITKVSTSSASVSWNTNLIAVSDLQIGLCDKGTTSQIANSDATTTFSYNLIDLTPGSDYCVIILASSSMADNNPVVKNDRWTTLSVPTAATITYQVNGQDWTNATWTNQSVTAILTTANPLSVTPNGWTQASSTRFVKVFEDNVVGVVEYEAYGMTNYATYTITKIDKKEPVIVFPKHIDHEVMVDFNEPSAIFCDYGESGCLGS